MTSALINHKPPNRYIPQIAPITHSRAGHPTNCLTGVTSTEFTPERWACTLMFTGLLVNRSAALCKIPHLSYTIKTCRTRASVSVIKSYKKAYVLCTRPITVVKFLLGMHVWPFIKTRYNKSIIAAVFLI